MTRARQRLSDWSQILGAPKRMSRRLIKQLECSVIVIRPDVMFILSRHMHI